jgi:dihydrofolate synthase/folylpolyglutamate synthase
MVKKHRTLQVAANKQTAPKVICDTAHNKNVLEIVLKQISKQKFDTLHFVLGVVNDKDLEEILPLSQNAKYFVKSKYSPCRSSIYNNKSQLFALKAKHTILFQKFIK